MDQWITRFVALLCAAGSAALFWSFGMFAAVPWRDGRLFAMTPVEWQVVGIPFLAAIAVGWGALHLFALAGDAPDEAAHRGRRLRLFLLIAVAIAAAASGASWSLARVAAA
ncbi:hypothetical protein HCX48_06215 [Rhodocyclus tenuis]|uniref:Uncharacterized protein n=2 Tax=Rhodocyclus TaxID=1064 RepID=A0A6L5JUQ9_RHOTE|nr:hypothetical protein [Rhodocyclus gracilis]MQY51105.1 hypothetical protein [Rhodocyclus gracilis]NJA88815.1 hypothetical protein [Rhodocyclus gracilis]